MKNGLVGYKWRVRVRVLFVAIMTNVGKGSTTDGGVVVSARVVKVNIVVMLRGNVVIV
jgi:hypothetical protein